MRNQLHLKMISLLSQNLPKINHSLTNFRLSRLLPKMTSLLSQSLNKNNLMVLNQLVSKISLGSQSRNSSNIMISSLSLPQKPISTMTSLASSNSLITLANIK